MMRVEPQPEPRPPGFDFDKEVRQPGLSALAELTGNAPTIQRPGPRIAKRADTIEDLDPQVVRDYAYWTRALAALHEAYRGVCAYSCFYIEPLSGPTVDHFVAITKTLREAYEWRNYRLAFALMNACKGAFADVLDPFEVQDGWFVLDLDTLDVEPGAGLEPDLTDRVLATCRRLQLNGSECKKMRRDFFNLYWSSQSPERPIPLWFLEMKAPFLAREMRRQGRVRPEHLAR
jgi:hypothetical protein